MVARDVVLAKVEAIDHCLGRIAEIRAGDRGLLPIDVEELTTLNLQRCAQAVIDLATHVVATEGYGVPETVAESFTLLEKHGVLAAELSGRLRKMVGFRNIAVHEYEAVNPEIVQAIVDHHLEDFRSFTAAVLSHFGFLQDE